MIDWLQKLVTLANAEAFAYDSSRGTCILTSFALCYVLQQFDLNARPLRVEAAIFPDDRKLYGSLIGRSGRQAAAPGMWQGHLVVAIDKEWLLDATIDQANKDEWPAGAHVGPIVVRLTEKFWAERGCVFVQAGESRVRFSLFPRQNGFARAPAARPLLWRPLAQRILAKMAPPPHASLAMLYTMRRNEGLFEPRDEQDENLFEFWWD